MPTNSPRWIFLAFLLAGVTVSEAASAACLAPREQRALVRSGEVMRPARIGRALDGEVLRLQLCEQGGRLVYQATVLGRNGRVRQRVVDARSGEALR